MEDCRKITSGRRRRTCGLEAEKRAGAIERLMSLRQGGHRTSADGSSYDVKLDEPIYQVMEEDEYKEFLNNRPKEVACYSGDDYILEINYPFKDEVRERDCHSDFILAIIRDMLPTCPHLRLVLMSATLDVGRFSQYFGRCPVITVSGLTYPVRSFYLEDVLSILHLAEDNHISFSSACALNDGLELNEEDKTALDEAISMAWSNDEFETLLDFVSAEGTAKVHNYQHSSSGITPLMVFAAKGRVHDVCVLLSHGADCQLDGKRALELAEQENQQETVDVIKKHMETNLSDSTRQPKLLDKYLATVDPGSIDVVLIEQLLRKICVDSNDGAILVFLPGWEDINKTRERLLASSFFSDPSRFIILSLHSMILSMEQKRVFKRASAGCREIILSTNIAEISITIDDVVYVIDSGRMKEKSYDPYNNVSTLQSSWVSKANARLGEGRAGRCQPGIRYHLYSKLRAVSMLDFQVPEIKRVPIEELCLQVKMFNRDQKVEDFLKKTLDPAVPEAIHNAITVLQDIGAFSHDGELTELGEKLGYLPVHPVTSKMIFFAILMNCLVTTLTIASASDFKAPFTLPMLPSERKKLSVVKSELASLYGGQGVQLAVMGAFECWKEAKVRSQEARFCSQYFVSSNAMIMLDGMRKQLLHELTSYGYISEDLASSNRNARNPGIVHAVLVAVFYPMVGRVSPTNNRKGFLIETPGGSKVRLHPHSSISNFPMEKADHPPLLIFDEITRGDGSMFLRNCTVIGPFPLFLHASELAVAPGNEDVDGDDSADEDEGNDDGAVMADKSGRSHEEKVSWCKFEVAVDSPKDIKTASSSNSTMEIPRVVVSAIDLKTIINEKQNANEVVSASIICCRKAKVPIQTIALGLFLISSIGTVSGVGPLREGSLINQLDGPSWLELFCFICGFICLGDPVLEAWKGLKEMSVSRWSHLRGFVYWVWICSYFHHLLYCREEGDMLSALLAMVGILAYFISFLLATLHHWPSSRLVAGYCMLGIVTAYTCHDSHFLKHVSMCFGVSANVASFIFQGDKTKPEWLDLCGTGLSVVTEAMVCGIFLRRGDLYGVVNLIGMILECVKGINYTLSALKSRRLKSEFERNAELLRVARNAELLRVERNAELLRIQWERNQRKMGKRHKKHLSNLDKLESELGSPVLDVEDRQQRRTASLV